MKKLTDTIWGRLLQVIYLGTYLTVLGIFVIGSISEYQSVQQNIQENKNIEIIKAKPDYEEFVKNELLSTPNPQMFQIGFSSKLEKKYGLDLPYDFKPNENITLNFIDQLIAVVVVFALIEIATFVFLYVLGIKALTLSKITFRTLCGNTTGVKFPPKIPEISEEILKTETKKISLKLFKLTLISIAIFVLVGIVMVIYYFFFPI